jgi:hypothetical protein
LIRRGARSRNRVAPCGLHSAYERDRWTAVEPNRANRDKISFTARRRDAETVRDLSPPLSGLASIALTASMSSSVSFSGGPAERFRRCVFRDFRTGLDGRFLPDRDPRDWFHAMLSPGISRHPGSMIARVRLRWLEEVCPMSANDPNRTAAR